MEKIILGIMIIVIIGVMAYSFYDIGRTNERIRILNKLSRISDRINQLETQRKSLTEQKDLDAMFERIMGMLDAEEIFLNFF